MKLLHDRSEVSNNKILGRTTAVLPTMQAWATLHLFPTSTIWSVQAQRWRNSKNKFTALTLNDKF